MGRWGAGAGLFRSQSSVHCLEKTVRADDSLPELKIAGGDGGDGEVG